MNAYRLFSFTLFLPFCWTLILPPSPQCTDFILSVEAFAENVVMNVEGDDRLATSIMSFLREVITGNVKLSNGTTQETSGTYDINARYCKPMWAVSGMASTVQILVHGATYNKAYWSGLMNPEFVSSNGSAYSWVNFANAHGYHTLAIDRLGTGASSRPDPVEIVQASFEVEIIHQIVQQLRNGGLYSTPFSNVIYVGHSYGSILGTQLADTYPNDLDALILTGWSAATFNLKGNPLLEALTPAQLINENIFDGLPGGYLGLENVSLREEFFYAGSYDPVIPLLDYAAQDTITIGELAGLQSVTASNFTGDVFVLTGHEDAVFCNGDCGTKTESVLAQALTDFPAAESFEYYAIPSTGHDLNFHYSASDAFSIAHSWLHKRGY